MPKEQEAFQQRKRDGGKRVFNTLTAGIFALSGPVSTPVYLEGSGTSRNSGCHMKKSVLEAYMLWLLLGLLGAHHFYLGRPGFGVLYFFTFGLGGCGWLIDMFRLPYLVNKANKELQENSNRNEKNISDAYTLWFPFGLLGFHHFYLNNYCFGVVYLFTFGVFLIGWTADSMIIPAWVSWANDARQSNRAIEENVSMHERQVGVATNRLKDERHHLSTQASGFGDGCQGNGQLQTFHNAKIAILGKTSGAECFGSPVEATILSVEPYQQQQLYLTQHAHRQASQYGPSKIGQNGPQRNGYEQPPAYTATNDVSSYLDEPPSYVPVVLY